LPWEEGCANLKKDRQEIAGFEAKHFLTASCLFSLIGRQPAIHGANYKKSQE